VVENIDAKRGGGAKGLGNIAQASSLGDPVFHVWRSEGPQENRSIRAMITVSRPISLRNLVASITENSERLSVCPTLSPNTPSLH
jgi:hypothetical protein